MFNAEKARELQENKRPKLEALEVILSRLESYCHECSYTVKSFTYSNNLWIKEFKVGTENSIKFIEFFTKLGFDVCFHRPYTVNHSMIPRIEIKW